MLWFSDTQLTGIFLKGEGLRGLEQRRHKGEVVACGFVGPVVRSAGTEKKDVKVVEAFETAGMPLCGSAFNAFCLSPLLAHPPCLLPLRIRKLQMSRERGSRIDRS